MARTSIIQREIKRNKIVNQLSEKRKLIKNQLQKLYIDPVSHHEEINKLQAKLSSMLRDGSPTRLTRRCQVTGRARGVYNRFGLSRSKFREFGMNGEIPGLKKSSW